MRLPDLRLNVAQLLREEVGSTRALEVQPGEALLSFRANLVRVPDGILAGIEATLKHEAECSRCLRTFEAEEQLSFDELYYEPSATEDPDTFEVVDAQTIDITEALRQYFLMAAAMQPLCKQDCPGLCPVCGTDLQDASCTCDRQPTDPRWQALAALRIDEG